MKQAIYLAGGFSLSVFSTDNFDAASPPDSTLMAVTARDVNLAGETLFE